VLKAIAAFASLLLFAVSALSQPVKLLNVSYDPTRELHEAINDAFAESWKAQTGQEVTIEQSHGGSAKQTRAVKDGLTADVFTPGTPQDVLTLEAAGLIRPGALARLPHNASPYTSTIVLLVREGNPKNLKTWRDLGNPGVSVIVPNPKTSAAARYAFLAIWGSVLKNNGDESAARELLSRTFRNVPVLDSGARASTLTFVQKGIGDVLITWENEAHLTLREFSDQKLEIIYPPESILAEPPVAVVDTNVDARGTRAAAEAYVNFFFTKEAQEIIAEHHYRPRDKDVLAKYTDQFPPVSLFTVDELFTDWPTAQRKFFDDGAIFDQLYRR
jgi:sulfate transport system substrate-binding protein